MQHQSTNRPHEIAALPPGGSLEIYVRFAVDRQTGIHETPAGSIEPDTADGNIETAFSSAINAAAEVYLGDRDSISVLGMIFRPDGTLDRSVDLTDTVHARIIEQVHQGYHDDLVLDRIPLPNAPRRIEDAFNEAVHDRKLAIREWEEELVPFPD